MAQGPIELVEFELTGAIPIRGLRPHSWTSAAPGVFSRGTSLLDPTTIVVQPNQGLPPETVVDLISSQLQVTLEANGTIDVEGEAWTSFIGVKDYDVYELILREGSEPFIVALVSTAEERDALREQVMLPVAAAAEWI